MIKKINTLKENIIFKGKGKMRYTYLDDFLINPLIGTDKLEKFEQESIDEVERMGIDDEYYKKQLIIYGTYKRVAANLLEAEGEAMKEKLQYYTKEWDNVYKRYKGSKGTTNSVYSIKINRG